MPRKIFFSNHSMSSTVLSSNQKQHKKDSNLTAGVGKPKKEWNEYLTDISQYKLSKQELLHRKKSLLSPNNILLTSDGEDSPSYPYINYPTPTTKRSKRPIFGDLNNLNISNQAGSSIDRSSTDLILRSKLQKFYVSPTVKRTPISLITEENYKDVNAESDESDKLASVYGSDIILQGGSLFENATLTSTKTPFNNSHSVSQSPPCKTVKQSHSTASQTTSKFSPYSLLKRAGTIPCSSQANIISTAKTTTSKVLSATPITTSSAHKSSIPTASKIKIFQKVNKDEFRIYQEMTIQLRALLKEMNSFEQLAGKRGCFESEERIMALGVDLSQAVQGDSNVNLPCIIRCLVQLVCQSMAYLLESQVEIHKEKGTAHLSSVKHGSPPSMAPSVREGVYSSYESPIQPNSKEATYRNGLRNRMSPMLSPHQNNTDSFSSTGTSTRLNHSTLEPISSAEQNFASYLLSQQDRLSDFRSRSETILKLASTLSFDADQQTSLHANNISTTAYTPSISITAVSIDNEDLDDPPIRQSNCNQCKDDVANFSDWRYVDQKNNTNVLKLTRFLSSKTATTDTIVSSGSDKSIEIPANLMTPEQNTFPARNSYSTSKQQREHSNVDSASKLDSISRTNLISSSTSDWLFNHPAVARPSNENENVGAKAHSDANTSIISGAYLSVTHSTGKYRIVTTPQHQRPESGDLLQPEPINNHKSLCRGLPRTHTTQRHSRAQAPSQTPSIRLPASTSPPSQAAHSTSTHAMISSDLPLSHTHPSTETMHPTHSSNTSVPEARQPHNTIHPSVSYTPNDRYSRIPSSAMLNTAYTNNMSSMPSAVLTSFQHSTIDSDTLNRAYTPFFETSPKTSADSSTMDGSPQIAMPVDPTIVAPMSQAQRDHTHPSAYSKSPVSALTDRETPSMIIPRDHAPKPLNILHTEANTLWNLSKENRVNQSYNSAPGTERANELNKNMKNSSELLFNLKETTQESNTAKINLDYAFMNAST